MDSSADMSSCIDSGAVPGSDGSAQTAPAADHILSSVEAEIDPDSGQPTLDFLGRVLMGSVKNFQLASRDNPDTVAFQFGKVSKRVSKQVLLVQ